MGKEAVRKGLLEGGGVKLIGSECSAGETSPVVGAILVSAKFRYIVKCIKNFQDALRLLAPSSAQPRSLSPGNPDDLAVMASVGALFGPFFAARVCPDADWAKTLLAVQTTVGP